MNKKSIFYSSDTSNGERRRRLHSSKPTKGTSGSSSSSATSSNKKSHHRRKRRRRPPTRSKSRKRTSSAKIASETPILRRPDEQLPLSSPLDTRSISDDEDDDDSIGIINNQLAEMNFQNEEEQCDDSDSLDEALDAENFDDDNGNSFILSNPTTNVQ
jgi:hypothetical protein